MRTTLAGIVLLCISCQYSAVHPGEASAPLAPSAAAPRAPFDVDGIIRQVHFAYRPHGEEWRGGHSTYEVRATAQGLALTPVRYMDSGAEPPGLPGGVELPTRREAERGTPLMLRAASVMRGDTRLSVESPRGQVERDGHLAFAHGNLVEHLRNSEQGVEQYWSFEAAPSGQGDLRVRIPVEGLDYTGTSERGLHFADARTGLGFSYGHGTWVDGRGRRTAIPAEFAEGHIHLRVPEAVLSASEYPAVLDPVISQEMIIDGRLVEADTTLRTHPVVAFNGSEHLVVWRNARGGLYELYGARISSAGVLLDPAGIALASGPGHAATPAVASNGTSFFVVWNDDRGGTWNTYGAHVSAAGEVSPPGGKPIPTSQNFQLSPKVASNGGDFLVTWQVYGADGHWDIYGRRFSSTGVPLDAVDLPIVAVPNLDEQGAVVASNGTHYLVGWIDVRDGYPRIYATRVSNAGQVVDGTGFPVSIANVGQSSPTVASNGVDFLMAWLDNRSGVTRDLYATRITAAGAVVDGTGLVLSANTTQYESQPAVAAYGTDFFATWMLWDADVTGARQILGSRVLGSGPSVDAVVDTSSLAFSPSQGNCENPKVTGSTSSYFLAWQCTDSGVTAIHDAWVSLAGTITPGAGLPLATTTLHQTEAAIASNEDNYLVVWTETTPSAMHIYGTRVSLQGGVLDTSGLLIGTALRERGSPAVASNGQDYLVSWSDFRDVNWDIYGARVLGSGPSASAVLDSGGFAISTDEAVQNEPAVASHGSDYLVIWRQAVEERGDLYGARVTSTGGVLDTSGIAIATNPVEHYSPKVASNTSNYLVVWAEEHEGTTSWDIVGARVSLEGVLVDPGGFLISDASMEQYAPSVASDGSGYFVAWADYRSGNTDIYGARVTDGGVVLDPLGIAICTELEHQYAPAVAFDGTSYVTAWADYRGDTLWDIYATQVSSAGGVATPDGFQVAWNVRETEPALSLGSAGGQQSLLVYSRYDTEPDQGSRRIRGRFISF